MLNWFADDGIYLPMINDHTRNRFYESIISESVNGKDCVDIGFGTGLLSMIALKHGARHIVAYEKDPQRYNLGKTIIDTLGLSSQITLINEMYDSKLSNSKYVTFSEILEQNIWGEGLWNCLPRMPTDTFLPTSYFLEIIDISLPKEFFFNQDLLFTPGIELPSSYCEALNTIISKSVVQSQYQEYISGLKGLLSKTCHYLLLKDNIKRTNLGGYIINTTDCSVSVNGKKTLINFDDVKIQFDLNLDQSVPHLLLPRVGIAANNHKLYLDMGTNWGPASGAKIVEPNINVVRITHQLDTGLISIE